MKKHKRVGTVYHGFKILDSRGKSKNLEFYIECPYCKEKQWAPYNIIHHKINGCNRECGSKNKWDIRYQEAVRHHEEYSRFSPKNKYVTESGKSLYNWWVGQRKAYKEGLLSEEQIEKLREIDPDFPQRPITPKRSKKPKMTLKGPGTNRPRKNRWEERYKEAVKYSEKHGDFNPPQEYITENGIKLGQWWAKQKSAYKSNRLTKERIEMLEEIGAEFPDKEYLRKSIWENWYQDAVKYCQQHGDFNPPRDYITEDGKKLGQWWANQKSAYNGTVTNQITEDQIKKLEEIGADFGPSRKRAWKDWYQDAVNYYQEHGKFDPPVSYVTEDGKKLGRWWMSVKAGYKGKGSYRITEERAQMLKKLGAELEEGNSFNNRWNEWFEEAEKYYRMNGDFNPPQKYITIDGKKLGMWWANQKAAYKGRSNNKITEEQIERLKSLGARFPSVRPEK